MSARAKTLVLSYFRMWNTGDTSAAADVVRAEYIDHAHPDVTGPVTLSEAIENSRSQDPAFHVFVDAVLGDGSMLNVVGRVQTSHAVSNRVWTFRIEEQIAEIWTYGGRR